MSELKKPTINELIIALQKVTKYDATRESTSRGENDPSWVSGKAMLEFNRNYLATLTAADIDKQNLLKVMDQISANGINHFNMTSFFGVIDRQDRIETMEDFGYEDVSRMQPSLFKTSGLLNAGTKSFNCDSVGCIAGFASAMALNWDDKKVEGMDNKINSYRGWEHLACNYLNIPIEIGELIFFGESGCLWSYLKVNSSQFDHLNFTEETQYALDNEDLAEDEWESMGIDLASINYKTAVSALSMIVEDELTFELRSGVWRPVLTDKYYDKLLN